MKGRRGLRIVAGDFKGRRVDSPSDGDVRPTQDRVRESLYNILGKRVKGTRVLDAFAGSGALGFEAISRGAAYVIFVDKSLKLLGAIDETVQDWSIADRARTIRAELPGQVSRLQGSGPFDLILADPPYAFTEWDELIVALSGAGLLAPDGMIVIEHADSVALDDAAGSLAIADRRTYGETALTFLRRSG